MSTLAVCLQSPALEQLWSGFWWDMSWLCLFCHFITPSVVSAFWWDTSHLLTQGIWQRQTDNQGIKGAALLWHANSSRQLSAHTQSVWLCPLFMIYDSLAWNATVTGERVLTNLQNRHLWPLCPHMPPSTHTSTHTIHATQRKHGCDSGTSTTAILQSG